MAVSTHRILVMIIALNLMFTIAVGVHNDPHIFDLDQISPYIDAQEQYADNLGDESTSINPSTWEQEGTVGNAIRMGLRLFSILIKGLNPFSLSFYSWNNWIETLLSIGIALFRGFMYYLIGMIIYDKFKNKKQD